MTKRLLYMVSHPIQYQAPLLRLIAADPEINLKVLFLSDKTSGTYFDEGFGREVAWDVPLREGYESALLAEVDISAELEKCDALWVHGWQHKEFRRALKQAKAIGKLTLMRGENWDGAMPDGAGLKGWAKRRYLDGIFSLCSGFLCIGTKNRDYFKSRGVAENRLFSMPYAVDNDFFAAGGTCDLDLPEGRPVILYAGKLMARKHPEWLLEAWRRADWPEGQKPILLYVGDGEMRGLLEAETDADVHFVGFRNQTELPGLYARAHVFVLPAEREAWGLAVNEAMACGTAVVASDQVAAAYDLITPETGAVFPVGDLDALAEALVRVTAGAEPMGQAAQKKVSAWDFQADLTGLKKALQMGTGT